MSTGHGGWPVSLCVVSNLPAKVRSVGWAFNISSSIYAIKPFLNNLVVHSDKGFESLNSTSTNSLCVHVRSLQTPVHSTVTLGVPIFLYPR